MTGGPLTGGPLAGRRIVVTRAQRQSDSLRERLEQQGAEVLLLPTIETVAPISYAPLDHALAAASGFDWLVLTSANAVRVLGERLALLQTPVNAIAHLKVAVVGPSTAEAAQQQGLAIALMPKEYVGEALAAALADRVRSHRVLLVRGASARDVVPEMLRAAGAEVTIVDAYQTVVPADAVACARKLFDAAPLPDAVVFTSGSTVTHLLDVLQQARRSLPSSVACVSIGPVTSAALRAAGMAVAAEAQTATLDGLVSACVHLLGSGFRGSPP